MRNTRRLLAIRIIPTVIVGCLLLSSLWTGCFFATAWFYHALGFTVTPFLVQIVNSFLGLGLFFLMIYGFFSWAASRPDARQRQRKVFEPIIEALGRIARGDFQVRLASAVEENVFTKELARSVNQMAEDLNQMEHMRQEFISHVSHEIQSPLTSIRGFARALHNEQLDGEERQRYLAIIEVESMRLSRMTDNMLKLASLDSEQMTLERKSYRLDKQIRAAILACEPLWTARDLEIDVALEDLDIFADEDLLGQVWSNLLHNSIKFTPESGKVQIEARQQGNRIACSFADTGIGVPYEEQKRIFERFYKVDKSQERAHEGSGLGLAIAKKIVELHHGTIGVTSQPGHGTTIRVALPAPLSTQQNCSV